MNYSEIRTTALAYIDRASDQETLDNFDNFMRVVESRVNSKLLTKQMTAVASTPIIDGVRFYALPDDFLSERSIAIANDAVLPTKRPLAYLAPEHMDIRNANGVDIDAYTIVGSNLQISSSQATTDGTKFIEIIYYKRILPLTTLNPTNWLSLRYPEVYVFGLMTEMNAFVKDADATQLWDTRFKEALDTIDLQEVRATWSGNPLVMRAS
jgi:hypothetical protein